jgi:hypothetical protein
MTDPALERSVRADLDLGGIDETEQRRLIHDAHGKRLAQHIGVAADALAKIRRDGPDRVLIDAGGEGLPLRRALERGIPPAAIVVIFVRNDGWTLGATRAGASTAYRLWADEWIGYVSQEYPTLCRPISGEEWWTR